VGEESLARSILLIAIAGIRLPLTLVSDLAWLAAHRSVRRPIQIGGWCAIVGSIPAALPVPLPLADVSASSGLF